MLSGSWGGLARSEPLQQRRAQRQPRQGHGRALCFDLPLQRIELGLRRGQRRSRLVHLLRRHDAALRQLFVALLRNANGVSMILEGQDGASAEARALHTHPHAAVFDNHMPRLSGIDAGVQLRKLQAALRSNSAVRA